MNISKPILSLKLLYSGKLGVDSIYYGLIVCLLVYDIYLIDGFHLKIFYYFKVTMRWSLCVSVCVG